MQQYISLLLSPNVKEMKARINAWYLVKLINFYIAKETTSKIKRPLTEWEKISVNNMTQTGSDPKYINSTYKSISKNKQLD